MKKLLMLAGGAAMAVALTSCGTPTPRDFDAEPVEDVEKGEVPDCFYLYDETDTEDDEGEPIGTYCRQG